MRAAGYDVGDALPPDSDTLMADLVERGHYDLDLLTDEQMAGALARVSPARYRAWFDELPSDRADEMRAQWGDPSLVEYYTDDDGTLALAGLQFGNVFVAVQPPRGYGMDKTASMHKPDLAPTYPYHAMYRWLAEPRQADGFGADAVVHMGKHGSLEWLPGKGVGSSATCYPELFLGDLPLIYPFIVDDPGEGASAKRRAHATIVDHLPPPMTTAETYGDLDQLERLVDEYYLLERTDPGRLPLLQEQIRALLEQANLEGEIETLLIEHAEETGIALMDDPLSLTHFSGEDFAHVVEDIHAYMHELGMAPIREGLHVLGTPPGRATRARRAPGHDAGQAAQRLGPEPQGQRRHRVRLRRAGGGEGARRSHHLDSGPLCRCTARPSRCVPTRPWRSRHGADAAVTIEANADAIEAVCRRSAVGCCVTCSAPTFDAAAIDAAIAEIMPSAHERRGASRAHAGVAGVRLRAPAATGLFRRTDEEVIHILAALDGRYVPPGASGAPTRGMAHVLPTGRNFYSVDPRSIPSTTAWMVGTDLARGVVERYLREEGTIPESVGISIWGTAAMRTSGDDLAQVLALLGVKPVWQLESRRVVGVEVIPLEELGRPRVDVVCRISGLLPRCVPPRHLAARRRLRTSVQIGRAPPTRTSCVPPGFATRDRLRSEGGGRGRGVAARRLPHLREQARHLRRGHFAAPGRPGLAQRRRPGRHLRELGRLRLHPRRVRHRRARRVP